MFQGLFERRIVETQRENEPQNENQLSGRDRGVVGISAGVRNPTQCSEKFISRKTVVHFDVVRHPLLVFSREILFSSLNVGLDYRDLLSHLCHHIGIHIIIVKIDLARECMLGPFVKVFFKKIVVG
mgnify:CR=1 FL=1